MTTPSNARPRNFLGSCWRVGLGLAAALASLSCSQRSVTVQLHPLQASGDVTYVCRTSELAPGIFGEGRPLSECNAASLWRRERDLYALLTQQETGEVAVVNVPLTPTSPQPGEGFVDIDPSVPGYGFLHIGARPVDIVSSPGGVASFVGVAEPGKTGIFALPTSCLSAPEKEEVERDLTTWSACSLPAAPGSMLMVVEPAAADGTITSECGGSSPEDVDAPLQAGRECPARLTQEGGPHGRRKLVVAMPDLGSIWVLDAQHLLDRPPGEFKACDKELELPLKVELPVTPIAQVIPDDLAQCGPSGLPLPAPPPTFRPTPKGFSFSDGTLYVADSTAPVVHAIDAKNPCALREIEPLLTRSLDNPKRVVTTSRVAVSPLTPSGKRFVYAIDQYDWPTASIMAFDVSPGSTNRTPLVRPGSPYVPIEAPDRIQFGGSPRDLTFVLRDRPQVDPATGNVVVGSVCDPDPNHSGDVGARYRPNNGNTLGARSLELRGLFATVLLSNGQLAIVDVEDFDAACRRPLTPNRTAVEDYRGCFNDAAGDFSEYRDPATGAATVTQEESCGIVQPHRARSAYLGVTSSNFGIHAPSLGGLPQLTVPTTASQSLFRDRPKLLAVDFPSVTPNKTSEPARVYVGTTLYENRAGVPNQLELNPDTATRYSVVLPFRELRAYPVSSGTRLTYEGRITATLPGGFLDAIEADGAGVPSFSSGRLLLHDRTMGYCDAGVHDAEVMSEIGGTRFELQDEAREAFGRAHSDYVVIAGDFPKEDDAYWAATGFSRSDCLAEFGTFDTVDLSDHRFFTVVDAQQQELMLEPRGLPAGSPEAQTRVRRATECFPAGVPYFVRASKVWLVNNSAAGVRHDLIPVWEKVSNPDGTQRDILNCRRDCNPRKRFFQSRVFEISRAPCQESVLGKDGEPVCLDSCVHEDRSRGVALDDPAARCIHATATERLAVYRGDKPSVRDMEFIWQTLGGFAAMRIDLSALTVSVSPQAVVPLPQFNWVSVVDAAALGLAQISLDSLSTLSPTQN